MKTSDVIENNAFIPKTKQKKPMNTLLVQNAT
jgi:hypothetical protein